MRYAFNYVFDDIGGFVGIDNSVKKGSVDVNADVVFGVNDLVSHIDDSSFHVNHPDVLSERVIVVQSWVEDVFVSSKFFLEPNVGCFDVLVGAATASADVSETADVVFVALVAILHGI